MLRTLAAPIGISLPLTGGPREGRSVSTIPTHMKMSLESHSQADVMKVSTPSSNMRAARL
jgi:hypothetical protein